MRISLIKSDKINELILPNVVKGNYWITDTDEYGNEKNLICIEASNGKWKLVSNTEVFCLHNNNPMPSVILENNNFYVIKNTTVNNGNMILYCSKVLDETYTSYSIEEYKNKEIVIGSKKADITYTAVNILEKHATITFNNENFIITPFGMTYVNNLVVKEPTILSNGDLIFLMGLKIIKQV